MSLLTTPTRVVLYNNVHVPNAHEHHSKAFWQHIINKEFFPEENWVISTESTPSSHPDYALRRVDFHVSNLNPAPKLRIFYITEIKRKGGSRYEAEAQVQESCQACVNETKSDVWAMAAIGTTAKMFRYTARNQFFPLTADYVDASQPEAQEIRDVFASMKQLVHVRKPSTQSQNTQSIAGSSRVADGWYPAQDGSNRMRYFKNGTWTNDYSP